VPARSPSFDALLARLDGAEAMLRATAAQILPPDAIVRVEAAADAMAQELADTWLAELADGAPLPVVAPAESGEPTLVAEAEATVMEGRPEEDDAPHVDDEDYDDEAYEAEADAYEDDPHSAFDDDYGSGGGFISFGAPPPDGAPPRHDTSLDDEDDLPAYLRPTRAPPEPADDETEEIDDEDALDEASEADEEDTLTEPEPEPPASGFIAFATSDEEEEQDDGPEEEEEPAEASSFIAFTEPEDEEGDEEEEEEEEDDEEEDDEPNSEWEDYEANTSQQPVSGLHSHGPSAIDLEDPLPEVDELPAPDDATEEAPAAFEDLDDDAIDELPGSVPEFADDDLEELTDEQEFTQMLRRPDGDLGALRSGPSIAMGQHAGAPPPPTPDFDDDEDDEEVTGVLPRMRRGPGGPAAIKLGADGPKVLGADDEEEEEIALGDTADYGDEEDPAAAAGAYGGLGVVEYEAEDEDEEEEEEEEEEATGAVMLSDAEFEALIKAAEQVARKDVKRGAVLWGDAIDANPYRVASYLQRAQLYIDLGDYVGAASDLQRAEVIDPKDAGVQLLLGELFYTRKDYAKAILYLDKALSLDDKNVTAYARRGMTFYFRKAYKRAVADLEMALKLDKNQTQVKPYLDRARAAMG